jgi:hypothetical protein
MKNIQTKDGGPGEITAVSFFDAIAIAKAAKGQQEPAADPIYVERLVVFSIDPEGKWNVSFFSHIAVSGQLLHLACPARGTSIY